MYMFTSFHFIICWLPHSLRVPIRKLHISVLSGHPAISDRHIRSIRSMRSPPPRFIVTKQSLCLEGRQEIAPGTVYSSDVGWPSFSLTLLHFQSLKKDQLESLEVDFHPDSQMFTKESLDLLQFFTAFLSFSHALRYRNASVRQEKNGWILRQQLCVLPGPAGDCKEPLENHRSYWWFNI